METKDTQIEGLTERLRKTFEGITFRLCNEYPKLARNSVDDSYLDPYVETAWQEYMDAHIPAVKALQEEVERLRFDRDTAIHSGEGAQRDLEALEATNAAQAEWIGELEAGLNDCATELGFDFLRPEFARASAALSKSSTPAESQLAAPAIKQQVAEEIVDCEDCSGTGSLGMTDAIGDFQPPEPIMCDSCSGSGKWKLSTPTQPVSANQPDGGKVPASRPAAKRYRRWIDCIQDLLKAGVPKHARQKAETVIQEIENSIKYGGCKCADASPSAPIAEGDK